MRQKKLLLMLTLLCTIVQGAWAEAGDTADTPITISSTEEWNTFVSNVNGGTNYSGKFVRLDADISVTEMAGSSETNSFQGTFLGNDKTLTFTKARRTAFEILQPLDFFGGEAGGLGNLPGGHHDTPFVRFRQQTGTLSPDFR